MSPAALLLLLAPMLREPVGRGMPGEEADPLRLRIATLLVGEPVTRGLVTVVPLHARKPSEAARGGGVRWAPGGLRAQAVKDRRFYLRVTNDGKEPVFLPAGALFQQGPCGYRVQRDAVIPPGFAALLPMETPPLIGGDQVTKDPAEYAGLLPGAIVASWFHEAQVDVAVFGDGSSVMDARANGRSTRALQALLAGVGGMPPSLEETLVGVVLLVAGRIESAHLCGSHELLQGMLPDLLRTAVMREQQVAALSEEPWGSIQRRALEVPAQALVLARLRALLDAEATWSESWGEGHEVNVVVRRERAVGHGIVSHDLDLIHAAFYWLHENWREPINPNRPGWRPPSGPGGTPGRPGSETAPGEVDRKPRPSLEEERQRERRPGPKEGGSRGDGRGG